MKKDSIKKNRPDYHRTTRAIVSMNKEACQTQDSKRRHNYRQDLDSEKLGWIIWLSQLEMILRGAPNLRINFHTMASPKCLGKPRSINQCIWWSVRSKLVDHVLVGDIKMDMEWRSLRISFGIRITHTRSGNYCVCDGGVHTHHAHFLRTFFLAWRTDTNTHDSRCLQCVCHISPPRPLHSHVSSAVFAVPARSLRHHVPVCTVFIELYQTQKRGSSALPHVRRGVWLPGRSHALNRLKVRGSEVHFFLRGWSFLVAFLVEVGGSGFQILFWGLWCSRDPSLSLQIARPPEPGRRASRSRLMAQRARPRDASNETESSAGTLSYSPRVVEGRRRRPHIFLGGHTPWPRVWWKRTHKAYVPDPLAESRKMLDTRGQTTKKIDGEDTKHVNNAEFPVRREGIGEVVKQLQIPRSEEGDSSNH